MSALNNSALIGASGSTGYQISRSVRLRSSASAYLTRTPASAGNRQTWTWSGWVKRGTLGANFSLMGAQANASATTQRFNMYYTASTDTLAVYDDLINASTNLQLITTQVFRDPSAWYHVVLAADTTQATASNRLKLYINGTQVTAFNAASYPTQNFNTAVNNNVAQYIGYYNNLGTTIFYYDGYLTEINFIDGQALTPSSFGETNPVTGVWQPRRYTGTYGNNGFYLNFSDPSAATAAAIGKDYSGNGNNWTPNNISVTAGATYDSMIDVPTLWADGGNGRGNYAVLNAVEPATSSTLSNGNITASISGITASSQSGTIVVTSGKWYWEVDETSVSNQSARIGILRGNLRPSAVSVSTNPNGVYYTSDATRIIDGTTTSYGSLWSTTGASYNIGVALDADAGTVTFYLGGVSQGAITLPSNSEGWKPHAMWGSATGTGTFNFNFGQRPFAYTPPSGFRALNTQNLPTPTILKGNQFFDATLWTGNGSTQSIVNSGAMQPDLVWIKSRSTTWWNHLIDSVRGPTKQLYSNATDVEGTVTDALTSFNSNGFSMGLNVGVNQNAATYVGWQWKEGATQGFDIVLYTGNSTASRSINHSLGVTPSMIIVKNRSAVQNWPVAHTSLTVGNLLLLDTTLATSAAGTRLRLGNSTAFTVGDAADYGITNQTGQNYVAYCFAAIAGYSAFGSYTGNGSTDGPFVFCGFRPRFVMFKRSDAASAWTMYDTARDLFNPEQNYIQAQSSAAEAAAVTFDILANGFKLRTTGDPNVNGGTYIYAAFAENPTKYALAR